ncbi:hypothetical protein YP1_063_00140 [Yersinia pseudotuberculosis NBRC 105692]|nr:hypothetical protein YP1_063_00140 [Yersinia pseudotuberculosis NBRC 105692]
MPLLTRTLLFYLTFYTPLANLCSFFIPQGYCNYIRINVKANDINYHYCLRKRKGAYKYMATN